MLLFRVDFYDIYLVDGTQMSLEMVSKWYRNNGDWQCIE